MSREHAPGALVSVIIPVYNAEAFVRQAVESALMQQETGEVILIEDASPDNSLALCRQTAGPHDCVTLPRFWERQNHGAGVGRSQGLRGAKRFLDSAILLTQAMAERELVSPLRIANYD